MPTETPTDMPKTITVSYRNWRGETRTRPITPISMRWGSTKWHKDEQWLIFALDPEDGIEKEFALADCNFRDAQAGEVSPA